jgi:PAS domain S-box-containing protein
MGKDKGSAAILKYVVIPGLLIIIVVAVLNFFIYKTELEFLRSIYNNEVAGTTAVVNRRLQSALIAAESVRAFFIGSQTVTEEEFNLFGSILTKNIVSGAIAVPLTIEWVDEQNIIRYVYPMDAVNAKAVGLDINQRPGLLQSIMKARTTRAPVITEPFMLVQGYPGIAIYSPIFKGDTYLGEAEVVIRLANLFAPISGSALIYDKNQYIQTENFIAPFDDDKIFNNNGERVVDPQGGLAIDPIAQEYAANNGNVASEDIVFADKTWQLKSSPTYIGDVNKRMGGYVVVSLFFASSIIVFLWLLQKRQRQLSGEMARAEALILSIGDGLVACDKNGVITFVNKKAEELFGYSAEESIGKSYYDVWRLIDGKGAPIPVQERQFYRALANREIVSVSTGSHLSILKKDGTHYPLASTIAPVLVNGKVDGAIVVFRDITKESEVDRMKTEFLSLVSRQLLTPSAAIRWVSERLLRGKYGALQKEQIESIQDIYAANEAEMNLVTSLLNVSRIESGRIVVDPKPTHLGDLVAEVAKELKNEIEKKEHSFNVVSEEGLPQINIDQNLIKQVYKNLLTNAIKYTPAKGNISITISKEKDAIISRVSDNGYGIPAKEKNKVFEKFYRGENIVAAEKGGSGLGLYLIKQIIEVSGGKIGFESEINKGTTFWFSLPLLGSARKAGEVSVI